MEYRVGIAGLGAIGMRLARALDGGEIPGMRLAAVSASDLDRAARRVADFAAPPMAVVAEDLAAHADIVVECAPKAIFEPSLDHTGVVSWAACSVSGVAVPPDDDTRHRSPR